MKVIGTLTNGIVGILIGGLISAFVSYTLYQWFLLPVGAPALTMGQLYGVLFFFSVARFKKEQDKEQDKEHEESFGLRVVTGLVESLLYGAMCLLIGYVIHLIVY